MPHTKNHGCSAEPFNAPTLLTKRSSLKALAAGGAGLALPAALIAQPAMPNPVRVFVGFAAGGGADLTARLLGDKMKDTLGTQFVVENRTGAAGKLALDAMRGGAADGSSLLLAPLVTPVLSQLIFKNPGYDPAKDMLPVGLVGIFDFCLAVAPNHPAKTVAEFVSWLKANPDKANFGSPSPGSLAHFFGVMMGRQIGVPMQHVAYRGGAPMLNDLMGGQIPSGIDTEAEMVQLHKAGRIRILGMFGKKRSDVLPDVPTMIESGFRDLHGNAWYSLWTKVGTPEAVVLRLNTALNSALRHPEVVQKFRAWGTDIAPGSPADLERLRLADIEKWRPVVVASGFSAD
jgi:tripartite-type tricarboxylate transporter receptor subunit TctC